jgi:predicted PhzF superfamily epimerase YddE/YHI9
MKVEVRVLRVFADADGRHGNHLGLVLDGAAVPRQRRIAVAAAVGYSATVFIDDLDAGMLRIYTPSVELPFAGHPVVGAAWAIAAETGAHPALLRTPGGVVPTWREGDDTWVTAGLAATPPWWHERLDSAAAVDRLDGPLDAAQDATQLWAWQDESRGVVRARVYAARLGIVEDEACGSASMRLAAALGRPLTVVHGAGSVIHVRPGGRPGTADVGGHTVAEPARLVPVEGDPTDPNEE